jgi:hypothetical protein
MYIDTDIVTDMDTYSHRHGNTNEVIYMDTHIDTDIDTYSHRHGHRCSQ